jgi:hypothetical protein
VAEENLVSVISDIDIPEMLKEFCELGGSLPDELVRDEAKIIQFGSTLSRLKRNGLCNGRLCQCF